MLMPSGQVVTLACLLGQTLHQLKDHFSQELKLPVNLILLMFDGNHLQSNSFCFIQNYQYIYLSNLILIDSILYSHQNLNYYLVNEMVLYW